MNSLVVVAVIGGAWLLLSVLAALWLGTLVQGPEREDDLADDSIAGDDPAELRRV